MEFLADLGLTVLLLVLEAMVLAALLLAEAIKGWAARKGTPAPEPTGRHALALGLAAAGCAAIAYGLSWTRLTMACIAQAVTASLFALALLVVVGTAWRRRMRRELRRRRLRRERLRWHAAQREVSTPSPATRHHRRHRRRPSR
ncbi:hypothetical protein ABT160_41965 [Streptomyces sp. NPDC001941]|uniref:hypothetical protein n=1 Tax=Streptomyces sp. NPDC001941 TaxID=3154659 RepID=UPI00332AA814